MEVLAKLFSLKINSTQSKEHAQNNFHNVASNLTGFQNLSGLVVERIYSKAIILQEAQWLMINGNKEIPFLGKMVFLNKIPD